MKITFQKVEIHNFLSFADEVFDFTENNGMTLVSGKNFDIPNSKNGSGKSTLFCSLLYGLYGQLPNKIKSENICNRYVDDKEVRVVVYLLVDSTMYKAISGLNKRSAGYFELYQIDNSKEISLTKSSISETRQFFEEEILHCDISLFLRTILLTSEQNYNFFYLRKQEKKEFIEKLFDIGIFGEMYDLIHRDSLQTDKQILSHQNQLIVLNQNEEDYASRQKLFDQQISEKRDKLTPKIQKLKEEIESFRSKVVNKNTELIKKYDDAKTKLEDARAKVYSLISESRVSDQKIASEVKLLQESVRQKQRSLDKHSDLVNRLCEDCQKIFLNYHNLTTYTDDIARETKQIQQKQEELDQSRVKTNSFQNKLEQIDQKIPLVRKKIVELNQEYDRVISEQNQREKELNVLQFNLDELQKKVNPYLEMLQKVQDNIKLENETLQKIESTSKYLKRAEKIVSQDSLKSLIIKDLIGIINNRIKTYLTKMGAKYTCLFDENLEYKFITDSGECELQNFSCGEKKRLEIATCLSFRDFISQRSNITSNILILDEYIDSGIDTLAVESILNILKDFTLQQNQNIYIISHRSEVNNDLFDHMIELQKKDGISKVVSVDR